MTYAKPSIRRPLAVLTAAALAATALVARAAPATGPTAGETPFVTVLVRNFDRWDANHDGTLTIDEVDKAVADPKVTGDDAAAVAGMKMVMRGRAGKELPPLTKAYFAEYNAKAIGTAAKLNPEDAPKATDGSIAPAATTGESTGPGRRKARLPNWDIDFKVAKRAMAADGTAAAWNLPAVASDLTHLHQSATMGDCWLVASVGSLTVHRPDDLRQLVKIQPDGSYVVNLFGAAPIHLPALTDAQRAMGATSVGDGAWVAVLEQAMGRAKNAEHGGSTDIDGNDRIIGGDSQEALGFLTGHKVHRITFPKTVAGRAAEKDKFLAEARKFLTETIAAHRGITAGIDPPREATADLPKIPPGFGIHHVYAIVDYDAKADMLTIWNPWGQTREPKGPEGLTNGYSVKSGQFHIPLADAYAIYTSFTFETTEPTTRASNATARADR